MTKRHPFRASWNPFNAARRWLAAPAFGSILDAPAPLLSMVFNDNTNYLVRNSATSADTFARVGSTWIPDFEGIYRTFAEDVIPIGNARVARNFCGSPVDLTEGAGTYWTDGASLGTVAAQVETLNSRAVYLLDISGVNAYWRSHSAGSPIYAGLTYTISWYAKAEVGSGGGTFPIGFYDGTYTRQLITLTEAWQRFSMTFIPVGSAFWYPGDSRLGTQTLNKALISSVQFEVTTGQANQNPSEFVETFRVYSTTNGNTVASNVITEATGVSLHPTESVEGIPRLVIYNAHVTGTPYTVGQHVFVTGYDTSDGLPRYYECTTAGTSSGTRPSFAVTGTTTDGTVTWTYRGHYSGPSFRYNPQKTQLLPYPLDFSSWTPAGVGLVTLTASQLSPSSTFSGYGIADDDAGGPELIRQDGVQINATTATQSICVKEDTSTESEFLFYDQSTSSIIATIRVTWTAGLPVFAVVSGTGTVGPTEKLVGGWYRVSLRVATTSGNLHRFYLYPASPALTGNGLFFNAQMETLGYTDIIPAAATRNADDLSIPVSGNFDNGEGSMLVDITFASIPVGITSLVSLTASTTSLLYWESNILKMTDGTNTATIALTPVEDSTYRVAGRWNGITGKMQLFLNGVAGSEATYDGAFTAGTDIEFNYASLYLTRLHSLNILATDLGAAALTSLSELNP